MGIDEGGLQVVVIKLFVEETCISAIIVHALCILLGSVKNIYS